MLGTGLPQKRKSKLWIHSRASHWERTEIILNKIPRYWINTTAAQIPAAEASGYRGCLPQLCVALFATRAAAAEQAQEHPCQQDKSPPAAGSTDLRLPESPPPRAEPPNAAHTHRPGAILMTPHRLHLPCLGCPLVPLTITSPYTNCQQDSCGFP